MVVVVLVGAEVVFVIISSVLTLTSPYKNAKQYQSDFNLSDIYVLYSLIVLNKVVASKSYKQSILDMRLFLKCGSATFVSKIQAPMADLLRH